MAPASSSCVPVIFVLLAACSPSLTLAESRTGDNHRKLGRGSFRANVNTSVFKQDLRAAIDEVLGCGGQISSESLAAIENELTPMWLSLPKNAKGRISRGPLRHLAHRYFQRTSSLVVRGFEPSRPASQSTWGNVNLLSQGVPAYVESVLESAHAQEHGFDLHDAVYMVATLEHLVFDSDKTLLELVYQQQGQSVDQSLDSQGLHELLQSYMIHWLMGSDAEGIDILLKNRTLLETVFPHWHDLVGFTRGQIHAADFKRQKVPDLTRRRGDTNAFRRGFTFDDTHNVVTSITKSFAHFWESECVSMKTQLVQMDSHQTGRVPLSKFYSSALDSEWRFGESETYLRELGVLDETSAWQGKQVLISNYLQSASNCIVTTPHYLVCCVNECEGVLREIENAIGGPAAAPSAILALVGNMTLQSTLDDDHPVPVQGSLAAQLSQIADASGGEVPLHGRLFAQWLHYAFPRECPFPHKTGTVNSVSPLEYGDNYMASATEMQEHTVSSNASDVLATVDKEDMQWMSQWSSEEELLLDVDLRAPWELRLPSAGTVVAVGLAAVGLVASSMGRGRARCASSCGGSGLLPLHGKAHFI